MHFAYILLHYLVAIRGILTTTNDTNAISTATDIPSDETTVEDQPVYPDIIIDSFQKNFHIFCTVFDIPPENCTCEATPLVCEVIIMVFKIVFCYPTEIHEIRFLMKC